MTLVHTSYSTWCIGHYKMEQKGKNAIKIQSLQPSQLGHLVCIKHCDNLH